MKLLQILGLTYLNLLVAATAWAQEPETCPQREPWKPTPTQLQRILNDHGRWTKIWIADAEKTLSRDLPKSAQRNLTWRANLCNADLENAPLNGVNLAGAQLSGANLAAAELTKADLRWAELIEANLNGAKLFAARLDNADLQYAQLNDAELGPDPNEPRPSDVILLGKGAKLNNADLSSAQLNNADLTAAVLDDATLFRTELHRAVLAHASLDGADLNEAQLEEADLEGASVAGAHLANANLTGAKYAPVSPECNSFVAGIKGLDTVVFPRGMETGLVQLRELLQKAGLRELERQATFAIERGKTRHAIADWHNPGDGAEAIFRMVAFDWTTGYGLYPGRALRIIAVLWLLLTLVYFWAIHFAANGSTAAGIYQVWPSDRIEINKGNASLSQSSNVDRLQTEPLAALGYAAYFSLLSAFHIGWRDLNVGTWIARVQPREYALRATGWVRVVSGVQSLLSVYLLAMWALTYFGRPFQ